MTDLLVHDCSVDSIDTAANLRELEHREEEIYRKLFMLGIRRMFNVWDEDGD